MGKVIPMLGGGGSGADLDMITATAADVRAGKVIVDKEGNPVTGTEPERGAWNGAVGMNAQVAIPEGHHNGAGKVSGPSVAYQNADVAGSDRAYATNVSAWGGVMCLGVRNGHYLNGVNWIQADIAGLQAANIREGINIGGLMGTLKDMSVNHVPFDGASFSGVLAKGAEICSWYNNNVLRNSVEITGDGLRMMYSRAKVQFTRDYTE